MSVGLTPTALLIDEASALLTRLARVKPFALQMPMVAAASISPLARSAIECHLARGRRGLRAMVLAFLRWLHSREGRSAGAAEAQRRFSFLRLRFNAGLTQFDIFSDVLTERSQHEFGVWVAGLDALAADALALPGYYDPPPVICYLDRGHGAAIRRARTRLPGGDENPVAVIRVPRERMVGSGVASSLIHEVGHQGASLLGLVESLRPVLAALHLRGGPDSLAWRLWERWISEILADLWAVAKVGITGTLGLLAVATLPRPFVFRVATDDPHPAPWVRVLLSSAMGDALYPHPQWSELVRAWKSYYPPEGLAADVQEALAVLQATMPAFVNVLVNHRSPSLRGRCLGQVLADPRLVPERLAAQFRQWRRRPWLMGRASPTYVFAVLGQARADGLLRPNVESNVLADLLAHWALHKSMNPCSVPAHGERVLPEESH